MHLVRILIMLCSVISAAFLVSATVGIAWGKNEGRNGKTYFGLWKVCDGIICHKFKESTVERKKNLDLTSFSSTLLVLSNTMPTLSFLSG